MATGSASRRVLLALAGLLLAGPAAAAAGPAVAAPKPTGGPACPACSLVVIGIDDVRADSFRALGAKEDLLPNLDRFAGSAFVFSQAISAAPWTLPSFMSLFTGLYPFNHHVTNKYADFKAEPMVLARLADLSPGTRTLTEILRERGWRTAGFTGGAALTGSFGFSAGFEVYEDSVTFGGFDRSVPAALRWLDGLGPKDKFFLFVHGYDAHAFNPEHFPEAFRERFRQMREENMERHDLRATDEERRLVQAGYKRSLAAMDARLKPLLDRLNSANLRERTVVVVVADHGEELFDHGGIDHGMTLFDELVHVPLLLRVPGLTPRVVPHQARTVDVLPTLLQILGVTGDEKLAKQLNGTSLVPMFHGADLHLDALSETDFLLQVSLRSLRTTAGWKLVYDRYSGSTRLYQLSKDSQEKRDLAEEMPDIAGLLSSSLLHMFQSR